MSDQEFPDLSRWDVVGQDELAQSEERLPEDKVVEAQVEAARRKATQTHSFRRSLFTTIRRALVATLAAAVSVMVLYMISEWGQIDPTVVISFNAAVVVNTIGLAYIVANYLFPKGGGD